MQLLTLMMDIINGMEPIVCISMEEIGVTINSGILKYLTMEIGKL